VVTLKGHSINKSGAMTGGASVSSGGDRWEEKEAEALRKRKGESYVLYVDCVICGVS